MKGSILLPAFAAIATLFSCTRTEVSVQENIPIAFSTYVANSVASKAGDTFKAQGDEFRAGDKIGLFSYYQKKASFNDISVPNFMFNQSLAFNGYSWRYSPLKYWPGDYGEEGDIDRLSFFSYYPYASLASSDTTGIRFLSKDGGTYKETSKGLPVISFTQKDKVNSQIDLMFNDFRDGTERNITGATYGGSVNLVFGHALALVSFEMREVEGMDMVIKSMSLSGVKGNGTCDLDASSETITINWTATGNSRTYTIPSLEDARLLMIPQSITDDIILRVEYDLTFEGADKGEDGTGTGTMITYADNRCEVSLTKMVDKDGNTVPSSITSWHAGRKYVYRINPGLERIEFGEIVEDSWTE
ncbi:MAG: fimbrillin family protein [Bacteroidales bacterium]|nr:fimbrillin family protein [Bacteroidales bacterium]